MYRRDGYGLIGLLLSIALIAILAVVVMRSWNGSFEMPQLEETNTIQKNSPVESQGRTQTGNGTITDVIDQTQELRDNLMQRDTDMMNELEKIKK
ncbi:MAG: hypothetical protein V1652_00675 [bacterium]